MLLKRQIERVPALGTCNRLSIAKKKRIQKSSSCITTRRDAKHNMENTTWNENE